MPKLSPLEQLAADYRNSIAKLRAARDGVRLAKLAVEDAERAEEAARQALYRFIAPPREGD